MHENISPDCATVATRGSVDKSVPFTPATIELLAGPAANTIGFEVRLPSALGEARVDQAFHAAAVCK